MLDIDVIGAFNAMKSVADANGCTLAMKDKLQQPCVDLETKTVHIARPNALWDEHTIRFWRGTGYHEVGHCHPAESDMLPMMKAKGLGFNSLLGKIINGIDDVRNEFIDYGLYVGRDQDLAYMQAVCAVKGTECLAAATSIDYDIALFADVLGWIYTYRADRQTALALPAAQYCALRTGAAKYSHLTPALHAITAPGTAEDIYNLALRIVDASGTHSSKEELEKAKTAASAKGEEGKDNEPSTGADSDKSASSDESSEEKSSSTTVSYEDLMKHTHDFKLKGKYSKPIRIVYDHRVRGFSPRPTSIAVNTKDLSYKRSDKSDIMATYSSIESLVSTTRRLFQSYVQQRIDRQKKTGKIDKRDLYKIPGGDTEVFYKKSNQSSFKGTAVTLLVDMSGSMASGHKYITAAAAAIALGSALQAIGVRLKVKGFTDSSDSALPEILVKDWHEVSDPDTLAGRFASYRRRLASNSDGEHILLAFKELQLQKEVRKILIVISDGQPATPWPGDAATYTKAVIQRIEKTDIEIYGIGVKNRDIDRFYSESCCIEDVSSLPVKLLDVIKKKIFP